MRLEAAFAAALFAVRATCSPKGDAAILARHADVNEQMRREADAAVQRHKRSVDVFGVPGGIWPTIAVPPGFTLAAGVQITPVAGMPMVTSAPSAVAAAASAIPTLSNGNIDAAAWNQKAQAACMAAMMALNGNAGNPSGIAVCYNVPYLDEERGLFEAELRMYNISAPTGAFVGVNAAEMEITLQYAGATIQATNSSNLPVKRDLINYHYEKRQLSGLPANFGGPSSSTTSTTPTSMAVAMPTGMGMPVTGGAIPGEVAIRKYVGAINANLLKAGMNISTMQPLLIPEISLEAQNPTTGQLANTSLSSAGTSFVAGFFSMSVAMNTSPADLLGKPAEDLAAAAAGLPTPFVVPGLAIEVIPVGVVITSVWCLVFFVTIGFGTFGRIQFRDQYRRAIKEQQTDGVQRF